MNTVCRVCLAGLVLAALLCAGCGTVGRQLYTAKPHVERAMPPAEVILPDRKGMSPEEVVTNLYTSYIDLCHRVLAGEQVDPAQAIATSSYLAPELVASLERVRAEMAAGPGGADPILCAQDVPNELHVDDVVTSGHNATVWLSSDLIGHSVAVELRQADAAWQIVNIHRPMGQEGAQSDAPVDWRRYENAAYGVTVSYPSTWAHEELLPDPDQPPIGPELVKVMVFLMPQSMADAKAAQQGPPDPDAPVIAPITFEIVEGGETTFRSIFPSASTRETLTLGQCSFSREVVALANDLYLVRYVAQHPGRADTWIVITDPITGFTDRVEDNADMISLLPEILASLSLY